MHPNSVLRTCLWLFVFEYDSQPPRGNPHFQKHTEIEEIRTAHNQLVTRFPDIMQRLISFTLKKSPILCFF